MPTQKELDEESGRNTLRSETMVGSGGKRETRVFSGGSKINQNSTEWGGKAEGAIFDVSTNTYSPDLDNQQGIDEDTNKRGKDDYERLPVQDAVGLPPYPPENPPVTNDALLVWDDTEEEGNWATEASLEDAGENTVSILVFNGTNLSKLEGYEVTPGVICQDGVPISGSILFKED